MHVSQHALDQIASCTCRSCYVAYPVYLLTRSTPIQVVKPHIEKVCLYIVKVKRFPLKTPGNLGKVCQKRQLIRSSHPCKIHITIFARNPDSAETVSRPSRDLTESESRAGPSCEVGNFPGCNLENSCHEGPIQKADFQHGNHGPKFRQLPQAVRQVILKAHVNLGHPSKEKLQELFRQQGYDSQVIDGISDLACSTCLMQSKPKASPAGNDSRAIGL